MNLATEFPDPAHPATLIACENKEEARRRLASLAKAMGAREPSRLGDQLALLIDGAYGHATTLRTPRSQRAVTRDRAAGDRRATRNEAN